MSYLKSIEFQYYPARVESKKPLGWIDLEYFCNAIREPRDDIKRVFNEIAQCEITGDMDTKATLKQENLFYFTPCIKSDGLGRSYSNIESWNGIAVLDFDHIENATSFKQFIFEKYKSVICGFLSPSKKGVKFLVRIPEVSSIDEFKQYFYGLGLKLDRYKGWDGSGQNCILPLFLSWDPDILIREEPHIWQLKGKKADFFSTKETIAVDIVTTDEDKKIILNNIQTAFQGISSNGHPQMRAACISLGGYVAGGYLSEAEAISFVFQLIESNGYLSKGIPGYKKTAQAAIKKGQEKLLKL